MLSCHWLACANLEVSLYPIPGILKKQFIEKGLCTMSYLEIEKVIGREIIDSRGNPTVEAEVWLADGTIGEAKQAALVAMMGQSRLLFEFMTTVIGEKYRQLDMTFTAKDMNLFFARLCEESEDVVHWSASTVKRIKAVLTNVLRENGYLEKIGSEMLCPVLIFDACRRALEEAGMQRFLVAFYTID